MAEQETKEVETTTEQTATEAIEVEENPEIARLKAELARQKAAVDKATKEAGDYKKQLRAKQTADEAAAEAERERQESIEKELNELRRERAVANTSKKLITFIQDEKVSTTIAEAIFGAENADLAIDAIGKAWAAREKALKMEFGRIPAPGVGASDGPSITKAQLDGMEYRDRLEFASKYPDEYNKLMGR